jgi:hypothetical protein
MPSIITGSVQGIYNTQIADQGRKLVAAESYEDAALIRARYELQDKVPEDSQYAIDSAQTVNFPGQVSVYTVHAMWLGGSMSVTVSTGPVKALDQVS